MRQRNRNTVRDTTGMELEPQAEQLGASGHIGLIRLGSGIFVRSVSWLAGPLSVWTHARVPALWLAQPRAFHVTERRDWPAAGPIASPRRGALPLGRTRQQATRHPPPWHSAPTSAGSFEWYAVCFWRGLPWALVKGVSLCSWNGVMESRQYRILFPRWVYFSVTIIWIRLK